MRRESDFAHAHAKNLAMMNVSNDMIIDYALALFCTHFSKRETHIVVVFQVAFG